MSLRTVLCEWWSRSVVVALLGAGLALPVAAQPCRLPTCSMQLPKDAGALNVRDFGAKGDGQTDDTAAILAAIAASGGDTGIRWWHDRIVYLPAGTYLVSDSLLKRYANGLFASGLALLGEAPERTTIRLADHAAGFQNAGAPRGIVMTTSKLIDTSNNRDYVNKGEGNDAYENFVENLTIDAGEGNPGAIGIDYLANNLGAIRNTVIQAHGDSGAIGIAMVRKFPGPALIQATQVKGFRIGIAVNHGEYGMTLSNIDLDGQIETGLRNDGNIVSAEHLTIKGAGKAGLRNDRAGGLITLVDSEVGTVVNRGTIVFRGTRAAFPGATSSAILDGVIQGDGALQPPSHSRPVPRVTIDTVDAGPSRNWVGVSGSTEEAPVDSTQALQRALNSGARTIYLKHGTFWISATLKIPASVHRILGMNSTLRVFPQRQPGFTPDQPLFLVDESGGPLQIEHLGMDNTNLGGQLGIRLASSRPLLLRDIMTIGLVMLDRAATGGNVALEDVCCGTLRIAGPAAVTARQFNTEGHGVRITNSGAPLSIVGIKTEQESTVAVTTDGGRTDILGGLIYMTQVASPNGPPIFITRDSTLSATFIEEVLLRGRGYRVYLRDENAGRVVEVEANTMPARGLGHIVGELSTGSH